MTLADLIDVLKHLSSQADASPGTEVEFTHYLINPPAHQGIDSNRWAGVAGFKLHFDEIGSLRKVEIEL